METDELTRLLVEARRHIPFVQANLIGTSWDRPEVVAEWRDAVRAEGVWAKRSGADVPLPQLADYRRLFGEPDEHPGSGRTRTISPRSSGSARSKTPGRVPIADLETACAAE